jgi:hypothetical protein
MKISVHDRLAQKEQVAVVGPCETTKRASQEVLIKSVVEARDVGVSDLSAAKVLDSHRAQDIELAARRSRCEDRDAVSQEAIDLYVKAHGQTIGKPTNTETVRLPVRQKREPIAKHREQRGLLEDGRRFRTRAGEAETAVLGTGDERTQRCQHYVRLSADVDGFGQRKHVAEQQIVCERPERLKPEQDGR